MDAEVYHRSSAGYRTVAEPPSRRAVTAQIGGFCVINLTESAAVYKVERHARIVAEPEHKAYHEQFVVPLGGIFHLLSLF